MARTNDLSEITKLLATYAGDATEALVDVVNDVSKEAVSKLKSQSPKKSGKYAKGWKVKKSKGRVEVLAVVYGGEPTYRLAHLLEYGHANRGGGRTPGMEHIKPVEEWAVGAVEDQFKAKLGRI